MSFKNINATGIVAEYNPLHLGHIHQIREIKKISSDPIIIVMSSNFTQRGEPAFMDKWIRAQTALISGADLVLELPVVYSCHNAGVFAKGAIDILASTSIVDKISFGVETISPFFKNTVDILVHEPEPFKVALKSFLEKGFSFVEARAKAAGSIYPESEKLLSQPNNSLALSYMCRIKEMAYKIETLPIERIGSGYHETSHDLQILSASAIRKAFREKRTDDIIHGLSDEVAQIIKNEAEKGRIYSTTERLWTFISFLLTREKPEDLKKYAEFSEGIENRFITKTTIATGWDDFLDICTTKRYPRSRLQRNLIHFLIGLDHRSNREYQKRGPAYIRALAATQTGRTLLKEIESKGDLPVISKFSQLKGNDYGTDMMKIERRSSSIWEMLIEGGDPSSVARRKPSMALSQNEGIVL